MSTIFLIDTSRKINEGNSYGTRYQDPPSTGTTMYGFLEVSDLVLIPTELINQYLVGHPQKTQHCN